MKLTLIRHGRPDEADTERPHDPPLTPLGHAQATAVGRVLAREGITHIVSSPLLRAQQTATPLAELTGLDIRIMPGWAEADQTSARYRSTETLRALGPVEWQRFLQDPLTYLGADPATFRREVANALDNTLQLAAKAHVAVFTHGMPINIVLSQVLGLSSIVHFAPGYGSVTRLAARSPQAIGVISVNELWHQDNPS